MKAVSRVSTHRVVQALEGSEDIKRSEHISCGAGIERK